jgi:hypothetical protein
VLITIGIISVVSAITIPNLITKYQKQQTVIRLRRVYNILSNAVRLSEADNGTMDGWDFPPSHNTKSEVLSFIKTYYLPYFKGAKIVERNDLEYNAPDGVMGQQGLSLLDGTILLFYSNIPYGYIWLFADINGTTGPNIVGRDIFVFDAYTFDPITASDKSKYRIKFWHANYRKWDSDSLVSVGRYACNKDNTDRYKNFNCGRLIELNNWKIPKDYPW